MYLSLTLLSLTSILGLATGCCVFNGIAYEVGETITDACVKLICRQPSRGVYKWYISSNQISEECDECCIRNDPFINTFDRFAETYGWHETCRYSLAEYIESWGRENPPTKFAVYGDFMRCLGRPMYTCVHYTSYQLDALPDNVLHVNHSDVCTIYNYDFSFSTVISSSQPPTPVIINNVNYNALAWKDEDGCLRILGADLLVHICPNFACIYTSTNNLNHLGGLCGKYNNIVKDDHTDKNNMYYPWNTNVPAFAMTWQVDPLPIGDEDCENDIAKLRGFECIEEELAKSKEICARYLEKCTADKETLISIINSCAEDLCPSPRGQDHWLEVALKFCLYQASKYDITIKG